MFLAEPCKDRDTETPLGLRPQAGRRVGFVRLIIAVMMGNRKDDLFASFIAARKEALAVFDAQRNVSADEA